MKKPDTEKISLRMENIWLKSEERIMEDVIRRIKKTGKITSTADYQINRLIEMGKTTEEVEQRIKEALNATYPEMYKLYDDVANWEYVRNKDIYEQINGNFIPPEDNEQLKQISAAIKKQTEDTLKNISGSFGFTIPMNGKKVFTPFAQYYQQYVDEAILDIVSGGFDYNTVIRRVVTQMTNSGLRTVPYDSGYSSRVPVAVRRAVLTGVAQLTGKVSEMNAAKLGTNYYEVDWHPGARPEHREWQGKVYSYDDLVNVCGLGTVTGLHGANCYHDYYPFFPGISERLYTDEWLEQQNREESKTKSWQGKEYDAYGQTQKQRQMETAMRAQREKVELLKKAGVDPEEVTIARAKYQAQLNEYARYCKKMGLPEQRERIYYDMQGRVVPYRKRLAVQKSVVKGESSDIIKVSKTKDKSRVIENIEQRNNVKGKPAAISRYDIALNKRQQKILEALDGYDSSVIVNKKEVSMYDLSALTAKTNVEYAMFTKGKDRLIIRGDEGSVNVTVERAEELKRAGYKWSGHTHPGIDDFVLMPSDGDKAILEVFEQEFSVVFNSNGKYYVFERE